MRRMRQARRALATLAFAALLGCTVRAPASTPSTTIQPPLELHSTVATYTFTRDLAGQYAADYPNSAFAIEKRSFAALLAGVENGAIDYFISSHVPPQAEIWAAPLALDGLAIVINPENAISNLRLADLRDIFSGRQRDWSALGWQANEPAAERAIIPLSLPPSSDVALEFQRLVTGALGITGQARLLPNPAPLLQEVAQNPNAIAYLPLSQAARQVKIITIDGIEPNESTLHKKIYPLRSTIYCHRPRRAARGLFQFLRLDTERGWPSASRRIPDQAALSAPRFRAALQRRGHLRRRGPRAAVDRRG